MKKIFRNNQVIITALAIMIAIAGYLNFTNKGANDTGLNSKYYEARKEMVVDDLNNITTKPEDTSSDKKDKKDTNSEDSTSKDSTSKDNKTDDKNDTEDVIAKGNVEGESVEASNTDDASTIGEAVMVNSNTSMNYFYNAKLSREQTRAKNKEELIEVVENTTLSDKKKEQAVNKIIELTANSERENAAEMMLQARGFENCVVSIVDGKADVIVDTSTITDEEVAQIVDIVNRKTGIANRNIVITPVNAKK